MGEGGLCISGGENINGRHSMKVDKGWEKIMNLTQFQSLGKIDALISEVGESGKQAKWLKLWKTP